MTGRWAVMDGMLGPAKAKHWVNGDRLDGTNATAICGMGPHWASRGWLPPSADTDLLPRCKRCEAKL